MLTLDLLRPGQTVSIVELLGSDPVAVRLAEMGLLPGEDVEVLGRAPLGDPMAIQVRGARLAIRARDARRIRVRAAALVEALPGTLLAAAVGS